eukprot:TRINITY_DN11087_c0_g1_i6.p1 TRINITY_DN11087_c0_g1~~TRINITY_DN11087_c0_g1_i6.p1  ORF type:complete len:574 (+),score=101.21 TRINITY_DN11087_c0_g1_i6:83-1804(+)
MDMDSQPLKNRLLLLLDQSKRSRNDELSKDIENALAAIDSNNEFRSRTSPCQSESYDFLAAAQSTWDDKLRARYVLVAREHLCPTRQRRTETSVKRDKLIDTISPAPLDLHMYIYDASDIFRELCQVMNPNYCPEGPDNHQLVLTAQPSHEFNNTMTRNDAEFTTRVSSSSRAVKAVATKAEYDASQQHSKLRGHLEQQADDLQRSLQAEQSYDIIDMPDNSLGQGQALAMQPRGAIKVVFATSTVPELRRRFQQLNLDVLQLGVDDHYLNPKRSIFIQQYQDRCQAALKHGRDDALLDLCRTGCPAGNRVDVWFRILCHDSYHDYRLKYNALWEDVMQYSTLTDRLVSADARFVCNLSDVYFVFQETVQEVLTVFARDASIAESLKLQPLPSHTGEADEPSIGNDDHSSGVLPMRGHVLLVAPLAYLSNSTAQVYSMFKALYQRYWHKLATISSDEDGILRLTQCYEVLMQHHHSRLWNHLTGCGIRPAAYAVRWMATAFASFLAADQLLLLWDRIIGYDTLILLPVLAVAVFAYRSKALYKATTKDMVDVVLSDLSTLSVVPLLQTSLFTS